MIEKLRVLGVIQARGGSKGIPKKNIYELSGHPLIAYTIAAAKASVYIDELVVSTDSDEIAQVAKKYGASVPFLRPEYLAGDTVPSVDSLQHAVVESESFFSKNYDIIIELPCVAPLRLSSDIDGALEKLTKTGATSVISVANTGEKHPVRLKRIVADVIEDFCSEYPEPAKGSRRQDLEPCFIRNGAIYAMTRTTLINNGSRHGVDSRPYLMPDERSINIDGTFDLMLADLMIKAGYCGNKPKVLALSSERSSDLKKDNPILVSAPLHFLPELRKNIDSNPNTIVLDNPTREEVRRSLKGAVGWICSPCPTYKIDEDLLSDAKYLRVIATPSTGTNHIDKQVCEKMGIKLISLKGTKVIEKIYASSEFTFALLLAAIRKIPEATKAVLAGDWRNIEDTLRGNELNGKTLGIVGYGRIGRNISKYANAFGANIYCYDPHVKANDSWVYQCSDVAELLSKADIVALCVHLDETTSGMVGADWFAKMKTGSVLINTSRGEVLDEQALIDALSCKRISLAAVDVISNEQRSDLSENILIDYAKRNDNLIITPHIAGLTYQSEEKATRYAFEALTEFLETTVK